MVSELQDYINEILTWPGNFVHAYGFGFVMIKFKVHDIKYEIVFNENLEVQYDLSGIGDHLNESAEFYKTDEGCSWSTRAPDNWIFMHLFETSRKRNADGSAPASAGSDQCGEGS